MRPHMYKDESQRCKSPADGGEGGEEQSGRNSLWCGYIIVVLNTVPSSLSHSPGVAQMGKRGGRAPEQRWRALLLGGEHTAPRR